MSKKKTGRSVKADPIVLGARLSIAEAVALHRLFTERVVEGTAIDIDGCQVEAIDTAILQLLVSLWLTGAKRGVECRWLAVSEPLRHMAKLIGVEASLKFDKVNTAHEHAVV